MRDLLEAWPLSGLYYLVSVYDLHLLDPLAGPFRALAGPFRGDIANSFRAGHVNGRFY